MLDVGHQIGGYTIVQLIGKGGMGEVYLGQHRRVARRAAIKVLIPELSQKATIVDRFFSEARATSLIRHPGIVEVIDCDVHDGQAYIIMELLEGESLGEYIHRTGPLSGDLGLALGVGVNAARAVGAAHELEMVTIIHRDLKPDNVFLHLPPGSDGSVVVKVLDFGIAKLAEQGVASQTSTGVLMGTPSYMSPEQCRGAKAVDARSDIYSLGCILYESFAGRPPFIFEGIGDLIIAHVSETPKPLTAVVPGLPPQVDGVIARMMAKRPEDRPQSMAEVAEDLLTVAGGLGFQITDHLRPRLPVERPAELIRALAGTPMPGGKSTPGTGPQKILAPQDSGAHRAQSLPTDPATPSALSQRPGYSSGPQQVLAGGTQVMPPTGPGTATLEHTPEPATRPGKRTTTLGTSAREISRQPSLTPKSRLPLVLGVGGAALAAIVVVMLSQGGQPPRSGKGAVPPEETTSAAPAPSETPTPEEPARPEPATVTITLSGVPSGSTVLVDGRSSALPIKIAKGPERHHVVVRAPGGAEKTMDVDGSESRTLDVGPLGGPATRAERDPAREARTRPPEPATTVPLREAAKSRESTRSSTSSRVRERSGQAAASAIEAPGPTKKPAKGAAAMEAITDI